MKLEEQIRCSLKYLKYVINRNKIIEIRIPGNLTYACYYNNHVEAFKSIWSKEPPRQKIPYNAPPYSGEANIYYTLNATDESLIARYPKLQIAKVTTTDTDITAYRHILIDADPVRPSLTSSTIEQKRKSAWVIKKISRHLKSKNIAHYLADSGNGFHIIIPCNYSTGELPRVKGFLFYLDSIFSTTEISIDTSVFNPARISKLYGTMACKGANLPKYPHRRSVIHFKAPIDDQDPLGAYKEEIEQILDSDSDSNSSKSSKSKALGSFEKSYERLKMVMEKAQIKYKEQDKHAQGNSPASVLFVFEKCPVHADDDGDTYECSVGIMKDSGAFFAKCQHDEKIKWPEFKKALKFDETYLPKEHTLSADDMAKEWVRPIGYNDDHFYFFCLQSNLVREVSTDKIFNCLPLLCTHDDYWELYCPDAITIHKNGQTTIDTKVVARKLMEACYKVGIYYKGENKGIGIYDDDGKIIGNFGDQLLCDGTSVNFFSIKGNYSIDKHIEISDTTATPEIFNKIVETFSHTTLSNKSDAWLYPSTVFNGIMSGLSTFRTHGWVTGATNSGKTEIQKKVKLMTDSIGACYLEGSQTEAGIRQPIRESSSILIWDEAEWTTNMSKIIELMRISSSGGVKIRGGKDGKSFIKYRVYTTFLFFSISDSASSDKANRDRIIFFNLQKSSGKDTKKWGDFLEEQFATVLTAENGRKVCRAMYDNAKKYLEYSRNVFKYMINYFYSFGKINEQSISRISNLYRGPISTYFLLRQEPINEVRVIDVLNELKNDGRFDDVLISVEENPNDFTQASEIFEHFMDSLINFKGSSLSVSQWINGEWAGGDEWDCKKILESRGIYIIETPNTDEIFIKLKNNHKELSVMFEKIGYQNYKKILTTIPGAMEKVRKINGKTMRGVEIPYTKKDKKTATLKYSETQNNYPFTKVLQTPVSYPVAQASEIEDFLKGVQP